MFCILIYFALKHNVNFNLITIAYSSSVELFASELIIHRSDMACFWVSQNDRSLTIPKSEEVDGVTVYVIEVKVGSVIWYVKHRYSDFYDLHQYLVTEHGVFKDILPPKKVIKNKCPIFIETRRNGLEAYLKFVFKYLQRAMPRTFLHFLDFHHYDIFFLVQNLAYHFYSEGDAVLESNKYYSFNILQLHAISECCKKPHPELEETDKRYDVSHVMDLCSQLQHLKITGVVAPYKNSNIIPNELSFELSAFHSLQSLNVVGVSLKNLYSVGHLRESLKTLKMHYTTITNISEVLMCDIVHKTTSSDNEIWHNITELDLSYNNITAIDTAVKLVPNVHILNLTQNKISSIINLTHLAHLSHVILSNNLISKCSNLHTKLGNVLFMDLSQNNVNSLQGFEKLYSLESLDVSCNQISNIDEIKYIGDLPCLEHLRLTGNPVAVIVDYRVKVLEHFGSRASEIYLDNEKSTQQEIDTVYILQALRIVKEGKTPNLNQNKYQNTLI